MPSFVRNQSGFTMPELIVVMAIVAILTSFAMVNLSTIQNKTFLSATIDTFLSDYKQQQIKAMTGDTEGTNATQSYGVYFEQDQYTLFRGSVYSSTAPSNFVISLGGNIEFSTIDVPQSQVVFSPGSGEVNNYSATDNSVVFHNITTGEQQTMTVNRYGVVTNIN